MMALYYLLAPYFNISTFSNKIWGYVFIYFLLFALLFIFNLNKEGQYYIILIIWHGYYYIILLCKPCQLYINYISYIMRFSILFIFFYYLIENRQYE